jgi:chitinase
MPNKIITAAIGAGRDIINTAYDIPALSKYLDLFHVMAYDYHGAWDKKTGSNAPLNGRDSNDYFSVVINKI